MTLTVESKDGRIKLFYYSKIKDRAMLSAPDESYSNASRQGIPILHSDIDSVIEALQLYKKRMTKVLGSDALK